MWRVRDDRLKRLQCEDQGWRLLYGDEDLAEQAEKLGIEVGDKVILYQDEDDFEVTASLDFRYVEFLGRETWVAYPDWSTQKDL
jgi:hypothetical protein